MSIPGHGCGQRQLRRAYSLAVLLAANTCLTGVPAPATAQTPAETSRGSMMHVQGQRPAPEARIVAPGVILAAPASEATLGLAIEPDGAAPVGSFVRIRGLPPTAALSDGHAISPGAWAVPIAALKTLKLIVPQGTAGKRDISIALVTTDGRVLNETRVALVIAAAGLIAPETRTSAPPATDVIVTPQPTPSPPPAVLKPSPPVAKTLEPAPAPPEPAKPASPEARTVPPPAQPAPPASSRITPEARKRADGYLARGLALIRDGDIASARLFLQRAAEEGLAEAALHMGATFDAVELRKFKALSLRADAAEARRWYERAAELGSAEATQRLKRLAAP